MQSSRERYQVLWNTRGGAWTPAGAEGTMTRLAGRYGGDYAVADVARVMRMPGLQNQKTDQAQLNPFLQYVARLL